MKNNAENKIPVGKEACMNAARRKRWVAPAMAAVALIMAGMLSGCGSDSVSSVVSSEDQYQQKVYVIGEIKDPSSSATGSISEVRGPSDAVKQVFVKRKTYDGVSADAPIFIAADQVLTLDDTVKKGLLDTYRNGYPIILVRGDETQINALLETLGRERNYRLPENFPYAELFAASRETGAHFMWSMYLPGVSQSDNATDTFVDSAKAQLSRAEMFRDWMKENGSRTSKMTAFTGEATKSLSKDGVSETDLTKLAQLSQSVLIFTDSITGNTYQFIYNMYSCHSFSTMDGKSYDWFYVEQVGTLNAATGYQGIQGDPASAYGGEIAKYYAGSYAMSNSMMSQGLVKSDQSVVLEAHSPETNNTKTSTKSGFSFDIGGDVGFKAGAGISAEGGSGSADINGALKTGVSISNEKSVDTYDCTVQNRCASSGYTDDAQWLYTFDRATQYGWYASWCRLNSPVKLSISTFQPVNKWIWRFSPNVREGKKSYRNNFAAALIVELITTRSGTALFWAPITGPYHDVTSTTFNGSVPLDYPPLIVAPSLNANFSAAGQVQYMDAHVSSDWFASSNQSWCQTVPTTGKGNNSQISVTVSPNTTGKERKATVTFTTSDGKGKDTMTVTQSQY
jgi:hypothetical protein